MSSLLERRVYRAIRDSLIEFGYPDCTEAMIEDAHETMLRGETWEQAKHGVISAFAFGELKKCIEEHGFDIRKPGTGGESK